ncbi:MAG: DegV family protein [Anaerolineales bacterium]|nr:DegV family protein [Anaerolineales bacterium]
MHIVTDSGCDLNLTAEQREDLGIRVVPLSVTLGGSTYEEGPDLNPAEFYSRLETSKDLPTTSQPPSGVFVELYRKLAKTSRSIFSIHISSGLSGTLDSARTAAAQVPEAEVTFFDTKTLSAGAGWMVEAAARARRAGWEKERILGLLERIRASTQTIFTLKELRFLIHGGRISHLKGLIASVLDIKPILGVDNRGDGKYIQLGQARTITGAIKGLADTLKERLSPDGPYRAQVVYALNPEDAAGLQQTIAEKISCYWLAAGRLSLVLGAHTGPSLIGAVVAPRSVFEGVS